MKDYKLKITIFVDVKSDLPIEEVIDEFSSNSEYLIPDTENVMVWDTQWMETEEREKY